MGEIKSQFDAPAASAASEGQASLATPDSRSLVTTKLPTVNKATVKSLLLGTYIDQMYPRFVNVPAIITHERFLLDFDASLAEIADSQKQLTKEMKKNILSILVATNDKLDVEELVKEIKKLGFKPASTDKVKNKATGKAALDDEVIAKFVTDLKNRMLKTTIESGLTSLIMQDVLSDQDNLNGLKGMNDISIDQVGSVIKHVQEFFADFVSNTEPASLSKRLTDSVTSIPAVKTAGALIKLFHEGTGGYVQARESHVMNELFNAAVGHSLVDVQPILEGRAYEITDIAFRDMRFSEVLATYIWGLNASAGIETDLTSKGSFSLSDMTANIITGIGHSVPFIPKEAGSIRLGVIKDNFKTVYMMHMFRRAYMNEPGDFAGRVMNAIDLRKFFDLDGEEKMFTRNLNSLSLAYSAYLDTVAFFKSMLSQPNILFEGWRNVSDKKQTAILKFMDSELFSKHEFSFSMTHPAYYKQSALAAHAAPSPFTGSPLYMNYHTSRKSWKDTPRYVDFSDPGRTVQVAVNKVLSGSFYDLTQDQLPLPRSIMSKALPIETINYLKLPIDAAIIGAQVSNMIYSLISAKKMNEIAKKNPLVGDFLLKNSERELFETPEELSRSLSMPLEVARHIWNANKGTIGGYREFYSFDHNNGVLYFCSNDLIPYFEVIVHDAPITHNLPPFVIQRPAVLTREHVAYTLDKGPLLSLGDMADPKITPDAKIAPGVVKKETPPVTQPGDDERSNDLTDESGNSDEASQGPSETTDSAPVE